MTTKEFKLPDVGEGVAEGELVSWLVAPGDTVTEDQPVAEVETDKALVEIPSSYNGTVKELLVEEGEMVPVGDVIITFTVDEEGDASEEAAEPAGDEAAGEAEGAEPIGEKAAAETPAAEDEKSATETAEPSTPDGRVFAPPSARRLARELGVDLGAVSGSGPGGRVSEADVRAHAEGGAGGEAASGGEDAPASSDDESASEPASAETGRKSAVSKRSESGSAEAAGRETTLAVPATRKVAREAGVDINDVPTDETRDGEAFVTAEQVEAYAAAQRGEGAETEAGEPAAAGTEPETGSAGADVAGPQPEETVPYRGVRRTIGKQMARSKYTAPHVTHHDTAEVDGLVEARETLKPKAEAKGVKLTYMPFMMKAIVAGLKEYPYLNSELREDDEEIAVKHYYNIGIAVATDAGLMVPVVENVDEKGIFELADEINDLAARARDRKLKPAEMKGGTFTITNFGAIGGEYATPIINYPETAILGLGAIEKRPVVREVDPDDSFLGDEGGEEVVPASTLPLSLSIDHRVIDGAVAAQFANTVMDHLEDPLLLLDA
ncbi:dihydrolipoamide acetyltransferase family protein [Haloparvum sedimenti]|uniref:dihydrolipoamide acetyltransferase family protein n=1 Tax=Haloparvum sedimenti TaxID=1678448 RepID=UPI00071E8A08|nr:dihydrolipoamide acetyltransferase family protein [Haloparvum sedimenti]